jgi:hypothetical protein
MSRYATIITDDDGCEVVSAIGAFEGAAPPARVGRFEAVPAGVLIGMVRGGSVDAVGGFGFPERLGGGALDLVRAKLKALPDVKLAKPVLAKPGAAKSGAARRKPRARPARAGKKARKKPARTSSKAAKPGIVDLAGTAGPAGILG